MKFLGSWLSALWVVCSTLSLDAADSDHARLDDVAIQSVTQCEARYTDALLHRKIDALTTLFADAYTNTSSSGELRNKARDRGANARPADHGLEEGVENDEDAGLHPKPG